MDFDFLRGDVVSFGFSSEEDGLDSSSWYFSVIFEGRAIRNWGEVGLVLSHSGGVGELTEKVE